MSGALGTVGQVIGTASQLLATANGLIPPQWVLALQKASFAGYGFWCDNAEFVTGRRQVEHLYPYKDDPLIENLGRMTRKINMTGFFNDQDALVWDQRNKFRDLVQNEPQWNTLVYPSIGSIQAYPVECTFNEGVNVGGGVVRFQISFIVAPDALQKGVTDTQGNLQTSATDAFGAFTQAFHNVVSGLSSTINTVEQAIGAAESFLAPVLLFVSAATAAFGAVAGLDTVLSGKKTVGLYLNGPLDDVNPALQNVPVNLSVDQTAANAVMLGIAQVVSSQTASTNAVSAVRVAADTPLDTITFATAVQNAVTTIVSVTINPRDQVRVLINSYNSLLDSFDAYTTLIRWNILAEILVAVSNYNLTSQQDVATLSNSLTPLYDNEINYTTDPIAFTAIRNLKSDLVNDLQTRGANLPSILTETRPKPTPSFVLAWQLYQDATRADELTLMNDVRNPLMFPTTFVALSS